MEPDIEMLKELQEKRGLSPGSMPAMRCKTCQKPCPGSSSGFCTWCGVLERVRNTPEPTQIKCGECGQNYPQRGEDQECPHCYKRRLFEQSEVQRQRERVAHLSRVLGGQKAYEEFIFERYKVNPSNKVAFDMAKAFDPKKDNLFLWGGCGSGKTHLATAIAHASANFGHWHCGVEVLKFPEMARRLRMKEPSEEDYIIDALAKKDVLVIDDLGVGKFTEFAIQILYEVIDRRVMSYKNGLIVTTNLGLDDLAKRMEDDRVTSRLAGICKVVKIAGEDWRLKK